MTLVELTHEQQVALVALVEAVAISDGMVSEDETREIDRIVEALGEDEYRSLLDEAEGQFANVSALQEFLVSIEDRGARELIFTTAMQEAMVEVTFDGADANLLDWLARVWEIDVKIDEQG